ncbi:MAG: nucleoside monophosphate kinase [Candidatus Berkelbacteria bacterium]|nr:nucleoside monophosphate kinase [Candidatus Berkelbacteria bacterium]
MSVINMPTPNSKKIFSFLGLPASGKGTQAKLLADKLQTDRIVGVGSLMREILASNSNDPFVTQIKKRYNEGTPQPDEVAIDLVKSYLDSDQSEDIILDNFPFSNAQAQFLLDYVKQNEHALWQKPVLIYLKSEPETIIHRALFRKVCAACETIYGDTDEMICEKCGGPLVVRSDDKEETLRHRIAIYQPKIKEVIDFYKNNDLFCLEVAADQPIESVALEINKRIDEYFVLYSN